MHNTVVFSPYTPVRAFEEVAEQIKEVILGRKLGHGDRLPSERSLAEQFQVGRLTIREALRTLETKGFIEIKKGSGGGAFVGTGNVGAVTSIIKDNFILEGLTSDQITEARAALECAAVDSAIARATEEDLECIEQHICDLEQGMDDPEMGLELIPKMIHFHVLIAEASHNLPFILFIRAILEWAQSRPILATWVPCEEARAYAKKSYRRMFQAIKDKNAGLARKLMLEHIEFMGVLLRNKKAEETSSRP